MSRAQEASNKSNESYGEVVQRLAAAQKSGKGAPAYSRFINRKLGRYLAAAFYLAGATPNMVTVISGCTTAAAIVMIALVSPTVVVGVIIGLLLILGYALDAADGQLARLQGGGSVSGEWLDHMVDAAKLSCLHLSVAISWYRFGDFDHKWLLVPLGFSAVQAVLFFAQILNEQLHRNHAPATASKSGPQAGESAPLLASLMKVPTDYGFLCVLFVFFGVTVVFQVGYVTMFVASTGYLILAVPKWYGQMNQLGRN